MLCFNLMQTLHSQGAVLATFFFFFLVCEDEELSVISGPLIFNACGQYHKMEFPSDNADIYIFNIAINIFLSVLRTTTLRR